MHAGFPKEVEVVAVESVVAFGVDNRATVDGVLSDKIHKDSRFMAMRLRWLREIVRRGFVTLRYVRTSDNVADVFTKLLSPSDHDRLRSALMSGYIRDMLPPALPVRSI